MCLRIDEIWYELCSSPKMLYRLSIFYMDVVYTHNSRLICFSHNSSPSVWAQTDWPCGWSHRLRNHPVWVGDASLPFTTYTSFGKVLFLFLFLTFCWIIFLSEAQIIIKTHSVIVRIKYMKMSLAHIKGLKCIYC